MSIVVPARARMMPVKSTAFSFLIPMFSMVNHVEAGTNGKDSHSPVSFNLLQRHKEYHSRGSE